MKLDHECVRNLLLYLEDNLEFNDRFDLNSMDFEEFGYSKEVVYYTATKLIEAGFINGKPQFASNSIMWFPIQSISWEGHSFLDNIRDDGVWKETKSRTSKFASASLEVVKDIASQVISGMILASI